MLEAMARPPKAATNAKAAPAASNKAAPAAKAPAAKAGAPRKVAPPKLHNMARYANTAAAMQQHSCCGHQVAGWILSAQHVVGCSSQQVSCRRNQLAFAMGVCGVPLTRVAG